MLTKPHPYVSRWTPLFAAALLCAAIPLFAQTPRYNVLWIVVDDLNTDVGCYGQPLVKTPNLDRLASRGVRFERAYCQYALCNPSRSSFLSGYGPDKTKVIEQDIVAREALPSAIFLPQLFRKQGYFTAAAGKIHHPGKHIDRPSWDSYEDAQGDAQQVAAQKERNGNPDRTPKWVRLDGPDEKTQDGQNTRTVARFLEDKSRGIQPFFLALGLHKPHVPWTAPKRFFDLYPPDQMPHRHWLTGNGPPQIALQTEWPVGTQAKPPSEGVAAYFACVSFMDANVGHILQTVDRFDLWKNTIVVFMGDHGFHLGDRNLWSKQTLFEQSLRVPLVVVLPDGTSAGRICSRTVQLLDVYPTLADLCGLPAPPDLQGHSLGPLIANPDAAWEHTAYSQVMHTGVEGRSVRTERWRYTEWEGGKQGIELYDHDLDPLELTNLAEKSELAQTRREMAKLLDQGRAPATR